MSAHITVVGLGPGAPSHVTVETLDAIAAAEHRYARTSIHPSAHLVPDARSFDDVYERADTFEQVYDVVTTELLGAARQLGSILYAVPGSPLVLERTVRLLLDAAAADDDLDVEVLPAMSFLDVAWARLGIDPVEAGVRLIDGHEFVTAAAGERGPLLVAHTHANWVLSDIKLAIDDAAGDVHRAAATVTILQALGTDDERIVTVPWDELDRAVNADHLTSIYIPELATPVGAGYIRFHQLARTLREQCPWDIDQTHESLLPYLVEEAFEVVDAVRALDPDDPATDDDLIEELGDLLYQIEFHATIAEQEGRFTIADVTQGVHDKLVRRHPHVFGDVEADTTDEVLGNWDAIKQSEKQRSSVLDGVPASLPALALAQQLGAKAAKVGFDWPDVGGAIDKIAEEAAELRQAIDDSDSDEIAEELGDLAFALVNVARHLGIDAEIAARGAAQKFERRFRTVEQLAATRGLDLKSSTLEALDALWTEAKQT